MATAPRRRRRVRSVGTSAQGSLFALQAGAAEQSRLKANFVDRNPYDLVLADYREYLARTKHGWVLKLREFLREVDWSEFEERYEGGGRWPYAPCVVMGLIAYGTMKGVSSLRGLEDLAELDVGAMWITGGSCPDHTVICRFVQRHRASLEGPFFEQLTTRVLAAVGGSSGFLAGDGSVLEAAASRFQIIRREAALEAARLAREAAAAEPSCTELQEQAAAAERVAAAAESRAEARRRNGDTAEESLTCKTDPESTVQKTKRGVFSPAYVVSALANQKRIIVAQAVHSSSEIAVFGELIDQAQRTVGGELGSIVLDSRYHCDSVLACAVERNVDVLTPAPDQAPRAKSSACFRKADFTYDESEDAYVCPAGKRLLARSRGQDTRRGVTYTNYRATAADCRACPLRSRCTKSTRGRLVRRFAGEEAREAMRSIVQHPSAQKLLRKRKGAIEPVFSETKLRQGMTRFRRFGLAGARLEWALCAMAHNLRRWVALKWAVLLACFLAALRGVRASMRGEKDAVGAGSTARWAHLLSAGPGGQHAGC